MASAPATIPAGVAAKRAPVRRDAIKLLQVTGAPEVLTLHLKRFATVGRTVKKVNTHVGFPIQLLVQEQPADGEQPKDGGSAPPPKTWGELDPKCALARSRPSSSGLAQPRPALLTSPRLACVRRRRSRLVRYSLFGVVEHSGTYRDGHYTAFIRVGGSTSRSGGEANASESAWTLFSDSKVTSVSEAQVLDAQAFLLFYARVG